MGGSEHRKLVKALQGAGYPPIELRSAEGGLALLLPFGARVLGLFAHDRGENFFWSNPQLTQVGCSVEALSKREFVNTGGDRTWISPEVDVFIEDLSDPWSTYRFPPSLDPGYYVAEQVGETVRMRGRATVPIHRKKTHCDVDIEKTIRMIPNPLRRAATVKDWLREIEYVGYELETSLHLLATPVPSVQIDLWHALMLPAGGEMLIPTWGRAEIRDVMAPTGADYLHKDKRFIRFRIDGARKHKISLRAISVMGRAGYLRQLEDTTWTLVVRNFLVNPSGEYVDVPWDDDTDSGYALQLYNDDGGPGSFGEMEYHTPAVGGDTDLSFYRDRSQVWAFRGGSSQIQVVAEQLLGEGILSDWRKLQ